MTSVVNAMRGLILGTPLQPWLWRSFAWIAVLLIIFIPLAVREYRRALA